MQDDFAEYLPCHARRSRSYIGRTRIAAAEADTIETIIFRGTRAELLARLALAPRILSGRDADPTDLRDDILTRGGLALLGEIQAAYATKSEGSTDEMGITWQALSLVTIALRYHNLAPRHVAMLKRRFNDMTSFHKQQVHRLVPLLSQFYRGVEFKEAGKHALSILKRKRRRIERKASEIGAAEVSKRTKAIEKKEREIKRAILGRFTVAKAKQLAFVAAHVLILRDKGRLFNSFGPELDSPDRGVTTGPGRIAVTSNVSYFKYHQSDRPRKLKKDGTPKLPRRQIIPDKDKPIPDRWWGKIKGAIRGGLANKEFWRRLLGPMAS